MIPNEEILKKSGIYSLIIEKNRQRIVKILIKIYNNSMTFLPNS